MIAGTLSVETQCSSISSTQRKGVVERLLGKPGGAACSMYGQRPEGADGVLYPEEQWHHSGSFRDDGVKWLIVKKGVSK